MFQTDVERAQAEILEQHHVVLFWYWGSLKHFSIFMRCKRAFFIWKSYFEKNKKHFLVLRSSTVSCLYAATTVESIPNYVNGHVQHSIVTTATGVYSWAARAKRYTEFNVWTQLNNFPWNFFAQFVCHFSKQLRMICHRSMRMLWNHRTPECPLKWFCRHRRCPIRYCHRRRCHQLNHPRAEHRIPAVIQHTHSHHNDTDGWWSYNMPFYSPTCDNKYYVGLSELIDLIALLHN